MTKQELLTFADHTLLSPTCTEQDIASICDDGMKYHTASVCIPATHIEFAKKYTNGKLPICTVIGFPLGYSTTEVKCFEARDAISKGADEIDMVANICYIRQGKFDLVCEDIRRVKEACGDKILKVIIETCLLTDDEKVEMCKVVGEAGADFIKTSTGFSTAGATPHDVEIFAANVPEGLKIKAAGGIKSFADAENFVNLGASRLGTSALVRIMKQEEQN